MAGTDKRIRKQPDRFNVCWDGDKHAPMSIRSQSTDKKKKQKDKNERFQQKKKKGDKDNSANSDKNQQKKKKAKETILLKVMCYLKLFYFSLFRV